VEKTYEEDVMTLPSDATRRDVGISAVAGSVEAEELIESLRAHRRFLLQTVEGITDEDACRRTTVSQLCLGGIIKHVAYVEAGWSDFIVRGLEAMRFDDTTLQAHADSFRFADGESLKDVVDNFEDVASRTDEIVRSARSLEAAHPLPDAPWFEQDGRWSVRRVALHLLAEISQHAGHADIIREALDGSKTMG